MVIKMARLSDAILGQFRGLLLLFGLFLVLFSYHTTAQDDNSMAITLSGGNLAGSSFTTTVSSNLPLTSATNPSHSPATSVPLHNALFTASTASAQQSQEVSMPTIPLPTDNPHYRKLLEQAPAMPPLQRTTEDSTALNGASVWNGTLAVRSEDEFQAMIDAFKPPRLLPCLKGLK